jgi:hypothetical protein
MLRAHLFIILLSRIAFSSSVLSSVSPTFRTAKQRGQRPTHPAGPGTGQVGAGDQRVGGQRTALISPQGRTLPLARLAVGALQPRPRNIDLDRTGAGPRVR